MTGRLACVTSQDVGCVGRRRPGGPALSGLLSLRGSGRLVQRHERLSLRSPRSSGRERGRRAGGLVACRRSSFLRLLVQSSVPSCAPVVVKREPISSSCGDSLVRRARPAPGSAHAQSLVLDLNAGRRAPPAVRGRLRRDAAAAAAGNGRSGVGCVRNERSSRGDDRRSDAGPRRSRCSRCRAGRRAVVGHVARPTAAVLRRKCPPKSVWGTIGVSRRPVRSDSRSIAASRFFHRRHRPDAWSAVARKSASDRVQIAVTAGRARECSRRSRLTAHARGPAFARHPPGGRTNMLPPKGGRTNMPPKRRLNSLPRAAGTEPIAGCLGAASPTTADRGS